MCRLGEIHKSGKVIGALLLCSAAAVDDLPAVSCPADFWPARSSDRSVLVPAAAEVLFPLSMHRRASTAGAAGNQP